MPMLSLLRHNPFRRIRPEPSWPRKIHDYTLPDRWGRALLAMTANPDNTNTASVIGDDFRIGDLFVYQGRSGITWYCPITESTTDPKIRDFHTLTLAAPVLRKRAVQGINDEPTDGARTGRYPGAAGRHRPGKLPSQDRCGAGR